MSEEIIKNNPDGDGNDSGLYNGEGAFASGGIGGVTDPGASTLGNIPTAEFGVTTGPNAVNPSGDAASGILRPEHALSICFSTGLVTINAWLEVAT